MHMLFREGNLIKQGAQVSCMEVGDIKHWAFLVSGFFACFTNHTSEEESEYDRMQREEDEHGDLLMRRDKEERDD